MDFNNGKYYLADSGLLTEADSIQFARDLRALERQGIIEWRDGAWQLVAGAETEQTPDGLVTRVRKENVAVPGELAASSVTSSGEPSHAQGVLQLTKATRPSENGSSSPDSNDQDSDQ